MFHRDRTATTLPARPSAPLAAATVRLLRAVGAACMNAADRAAECGRDRAADRNWLAGARAYAFADNLAERKGLVHA
jgi:hypothetical protein